MASTFLRFLDHTQRRTTVGRTPLDEWSARRRDLYLTTHNTHNRQIFMPPVGFEPTISAGEWPQAYTLDRAATGTGSPLKLVLKKQFLGGKNIWGHFPSPFLLQRGTPLAGSLHCGRVTQICVFNTVKLGTSASSPSCHSTRRNVSRGITPSSTTRVFDGYFLKISVHINS